MSAVASQPPLLSRLNFLLARARFFSISILIHVILLMLGGSVVLIRNYAEAPDFQAGDGGIISSEVTPAPPPDPLVQDTPKFEVAAPQVSTPSMNVLNVISPTPATFQVASVATTRLDGKLGGLDSAAKGLGEKLASVSAIGGMVGGTSRFFGRKEQTPNALVGTLYDLKQTRNRKPTEISVIDYGNVISKFVREGWRESVLRDYFRAPQPLYTTQLFIPDMQADEGPKAFDADKEVQPSRWVVHYQGKVSPPEDAVVRFVGAGDDYLVIRFNGKVVLDHGFYSASEWQSDRYYDYGWTKLPKGFARSEELRVKAGQSYDLELLIGERPGGRVFFCLLIEEQGVEHRKDAKGNPILPVFRLADGPFPELQKGQTLPPYQTSGPIWKATGKPGSGGN